MRTVQDILEERAEQLREVSAKLQAAKGLLRDWREYAHNHEAWPGNELLPNLRAETARLLGEERP